MNTVWILWGSLLMFLAVALGAFGAHGLKSHLSAYGMEIYRVAVLYHLIHGLALFIVAWLANQTVDPRIGYAGIAFVGGILLFSGSLYVLAVTETKWLGAITPLGGLSFLAGWLFIFLTFLKI